MSMGKIQKKPQKKNQVFKTEKKTNSPVNTNKISQSKPSEETEIIGTQKVSNQHEEIPTDKTQVLGANTPVDVPKSGFYWNRP